MRAITLPHTGERIDISYLTSLHIKAYDRDNLYPQRMSDLINASSTGRACLDRYARFIEGGGLNDVKLSEIDAAEDTPLDEVVSAISRDLARFGGFALHVNWGVAEDGYKVTSLSPIPFDRCRLVEDDDAGYVGRIAVHPDWRGKRTRGGRTLRVSADTIDYFPRFNPRQEVLQAQIFAAGGIDYYKGQILWVSSAGANTYPLPKYDSVATELSADEGLSNVKFRNVRNNFLPSCIFLSRQSQSLNNDDPQSDDDFFKEVSNGYAKTLEQFQGDMRSNNILHLTVGANEMPPEIKEFPVKNFDKDFEVTDRSVVERIYCAFEQEPFLSIRNGKLGFSGDVIQDAYNFYSALVYKEQRMIERALSRVLSHWHDAASVARGDFSIKPLVYSSGKDEVTTTNDEL